MKSLNYELFNRIEKEAEISPRRRMHYDLRTQAEETTVKGLGFMVHGSQDLRNERAELETQSFCPSGEP